MATLKGIQETHPRMSYCGVHQLVNSRNGEGAFWTGFIQVSEVHAHSPFPNFLLNYYCVGQSLRIGNLLNGPSLLVNFRNGEWVFWTGFIQVNEVHAHLPFPIFLLNYYCVGQPLGIENLLNGLSLLQLLYLCLNCLGVIFE